MVFAMPLVVGESAETYARLGARVVKAVKPRDFIEEILLHDLVDLTWEILRLRQLKSRLLTQFLRAGGDNNILSSLSESDVKALDELRISAQTDSNAEQKYISLWESVAGVRKFTELGLIDIGTNISWELARNLEPVERFDRMIASAETRRNNTLYEIDRHRADLGAALRSVTTEVEDAEFTELETGEQVAGAAE